MSSLDDAETQLLQPSSSTTSRNPKKGGLITFPFLIATRAGLTLAALGWSANLIVYLINEFNVKSIDAAQIFNVVNGCMALFPIFVAIIADSFLGCFNVIWISSIISFLGMVLLTLTATISSLRPAPCDQGSSFCETSSPLQYTNLFLAMSLASLGCAGTSFTVGTMGADQLDNPEHQENFFNWFLFVWNAASIISATVIVYVQDNVSWGLGYGLCAAANLLGLIGFVLGKHFYRHVQPQGSPFKDIARVVYAAFSKRKLFLSTRSDDYYSELHHHGIDDQHNGIKELAAAAATPKETFKFLNRAALITQADVQSDGSITQSWKLCTVQQVEDLKTLIRIAPIWATGIFLTTPMGMLSTLTVLQALTMDTRIVPNFKFPVGSMIVFSLVSGAISLTIVDRLIFPLWQKTFGKSPTPLQRLGTGHVLNVLSMAIAALVESKRLQLARAQDIQDLTSSVVPMSVLWLVPQLALMGMGEAFHFPGQASLYYQEFPASLKSTSTAMVAMLIAIGYYLSTALTDLMRKVTIWLPDDLNHGRLNNLYWVLFATGALNFGLYLRSAGVYKYRDEGDNAVDDSSSTRDRKLYC